MRGVGLYFTAMCQGGVMSQQLALNKPSGDGLLSFIAFANLLVITTQQWLAAELLVKHPQTPTLFSLAGNVRKEPHP